MRSGATATPAPRRSCPRIVEDGCSAGTSLRRNTTAGVASRGMVSSASIGSVGARIIRPVGWALLGAIGDEAALEVVGGDADGDAVAADHADPVLAHLSVEAGEHLVVLAAFDLVVASRQHFRHDSLQLDQVFLAHPLSVYPARRGPRSDAFRGNLLFSFVRPPLSTATLSSGARRSRAARSTTTSVRATMAAEKTTVHGPPSCRAA